MSDGIGKEMLLGRLRPNDRRLWSIVNELAQTPEPERRRILRPHAEAGFARERDSVLIEQRESLDRALGALTILEIGYQTGIVTPDEQTPPEAAKLRELFLESEALLRYANAYLYFGVRFLAGRIAPPAWMKDNPEPRTSNQRPFALLVPNPLSPASETDPPFATFLNLPRSSEVAEALKFLDDFLKNPTEPEHFELWLQGLRPETVALQQARFAAIAAGLTQWAVMRSEFYLSLQPASTMPPPPPTDTENGLNKERADRPLGGWVVTNPLAARLALADVYWIARLLRADVSASASVAYSRRSWLHLLRFHAILWEDRRVTEALRKAEEVLRSVFALVCDLVQNAVQLSEQAERQAFEPDPFNNPPPETAKWREVFDEELEEIELQRDRRRYSDGKSWPGTRSSRRDGWSERNKTGRQPRNLIGLAFSGGGIRSATFNLGVLQGLQEFDLLRYVDYLSTVSGGGFVGSWLVANVYRTAHWLGRLTSWEESIYHLRCYSNYLAPRTGVLSPDTWTMWASWARNAFLIQITGFAWLGSVLLAFLFGQSLFTGAGVLPALPIGQVPYAGALAGLMGLSVVITLVFNLGGITGVIRTGAAKGKRVRWLAVVPSWIACFLIASLLWADATGRSAFSKSFKNAHTYSDVLLTAWHPWSILLWFVFGALLIIAAITLWRNRWLAFLISPLCVGALYLQLCGIMRLFLAWSTDRYHFEWYAYVFGPTLVLAANALSVLLFIGFCGRSSSEALREWWTRFGAWLAMYGALYLLLATAAVFGPLCVLLLYESHTHWAIKWGALASWIGTVIGGLFAGNSSKTTGNASKSKAPVLEILAKVGGLLFIAGAVLIVATTSYALLLNIATNYSFSSYLYWKALNEIAPTTVLIAAVATVFCGLLFSWFFEINIFGLNQFYRNRLIRCYLGATRWAPGLRKP